MHSFGVCSLSLVSGRRDPNDQSEMVTQLLFACPTSAALSLTNQTNKLPE